MKFLVEDNLDYAIQKIAKEPGSRCAVAFIGHGAYDLFECGSDYPKRIICNLTSGGTNPYEVERLRGVAEVRHCDTLHAKVYIGESDAVVGSANASANGLGLEGPEQDRWIEAGVLLEEVGAINRWFEIRWNEAEDISEDDLNKAKRLWASRRKHKPSLKSFEEFNVNASDLPLLSWYGNTNWKECKTEIEKEIGWFDERVKAAIGNGIESDNQDDQNLLCERGWVLCYRVTDAGYIHQGQKYENPGWVRMEMVIPGAFRYWGNNNRWERETHDCVVALSEDKKDPPFDVEETVFRNAFVDVMNREKFEPLRNEDSDNEQDKSWFKDRESLMREFWRELKAEYLKIKHTE